MNKKFKLRRGLKNAFAAEIIADDEENYTVGTPFRVTMMGTMTRSVDSEKRDYYYDDDVFDTVGREGATNVAIDGTSISSDIIANITNKHIDAATGAILDDGDYKPKYYAFGAEAEATDGSSELFWFQKGTFAIPDKSDKTKDDTTDANGMTLNYSAVKTKHVFTNGKKSKCVHIDTDTSELKTGQSWTAQVVTPDNLSTIVQLIPST